MRMTGWPAASSACGELVAAAVVRAGQVEADEDAVRAVVGDVAERLEVDRDDPDAALAGALGDELLQPRPEAADLVVGQERQLVAAVGGQRADRDAERDARVRLGVRLAAGAEHRGRGGQQRVEVEPDQRRRHEPDVGERRVAAADVRRVEEDLAEVVVVLDRVEALARVRDGGEEGAGTVIDVVPDGVEGVLDALPLVGEEGVRLGRRAGLAGDDHQRPERVEVVQGRRDVGRVGRVEDAQREVAVLAAEGAMEDVRGEAAAAHPGDDGGRVALVDDAVAEALEPGGALAEMRRRVEPAEPVEDGLLDAGIGRPQRRVAGEDPVDPVLGPGALDGRGEGGGAVAEGESGRVDGGRGGVGHVASEG